MFYNIVLFFINIIFRIFRIFFRIKIIGEFPKDENERYIICSNHGNVLDPIFLAIAYDRQIHFMAKRELFNNKILGNIFKGLNAFPVDRDGNDISALKKSVKKLKNGNTLGIFIEGTRVDQYNPENAKSGPILIANMGNAKIIPVKIESNYKLFSTVNIYIKDVYTVNKKELKEDNHNGYKNQAKKVLNIIYNG